jgi:hypothetical protein
MMIQKILFCLIILFCMQSNAQLVPSLTGSNVTKEDAQAALDFHNKVRKDVSVPPLEWSTELSAFAQLWANKLAEGGCKLEHRPSSGKWAQLYGENIYFGTAKGLTTLDASKAWYSEIKRLYRYAYHTEFYEGGALYSNGLEVNVPVRNSKSYLSIWCNNHCSQLQPLRKLHGKKAVLNF